MKHKAPERYWRSRCGELCTRRVQLGGFGNDDGVAWYWVEFRCPKSRWYHLDLIEHTHKKFYVETAEAQAILESV